MTNDEYSQLAAKAAGVTIGSNGRPAFTSYEQSMKYAEALTNLHKSGINKNSTPQEIAAASVGTTVGQNGRPNISSISQGVGYGSALKNLNSNPQPNVNQNSNGAKPNTTGSQNNTNNKANTNPTGSTKPSSSTKPSGSTTANRSASSTNSTSSSTRLSNADYNRLAAQIVGVPTDKNGNPVCNSYEQYMQFGQTLSNLHNGGINANSTPHEIAAASVGAKNNTLNIFNPSQLMGYNKALVNLLKGTQQGVSYVEPDSNGAKSNSSNNVNQMTNPSKPNNNSGDKDNINNNSQSTDSTSLSMALTGSHSESFENYLRNLEKTYGTQYVFENVFKGDRNKYDPVKRAADISGVNIESLAQVQNAGGTGFKKFINAYNPSYRLREENISRFVSYDQNGGWFGDGSAACKATSLAILASINSGTYIKPNEVGAQEKDGYLDTPVSSVKGFDGNTYNVNVILDKNDITPAQQLNKIKNSLRQGNAIAVEVTTQNGSHHWVVVTGTVEGCSIDDISSINDLVGIDPWYGSCSSKPGNKLAVDSSKSATINLGDTNKKLGSYNGYGYMTVS